MLAAALLLSLAMRTAAAQAVWREDFEGPQPSWREAGGDVRYRVEGHERVDGVARSEGLTETIRFSAGAGTSVFFAHEVPPARIIDELGIRLWFLAERSGAQIMAQVVLPRTIDPRSGQAATILVRGSSYTHAGQWQQLSLDGLPRAVERAVEVLRAQLGPQCDAREAYVDHVLMNVYTGAGTAQVWFDDLELIGVVSREAIVASTVDVATGGWTLASAQPGPSALAGQTRPSGPLAQPARGAVSSAAGWSAAADQSAWMAATGGPALAATRGGMTAGAQKVALSGATLLVDGKPFFPRIIQHQGEPLAWLAARGFNAVHLSRPPTPDVAAEAQQADVWLICPPPDLPPADDSGTTAPARIGPGYERVLAWHLGDDLSSPQLERTRHLAERLRQADVETARPLICQAVAQLRSYSRAVDLLLLGRQPLATSLELGSYVAWLRDQPRLARPGTPFWVTVQSEPPAELVRQWVALTGSPPNQPALGADQIRLMVYAALAAGPRGLYFTSRSPLDAADPLTEYRAQALEAVNLELQMFDPWTAGGTFVGPLTAEGEPQVDGSVWRTQRSRLLLPFWSGPATQYVPHQAATNDLAPIIPGVPEATDAYQITPAGLRALRHKRVTGGIRVVIDEFGVADALLLTQDPLVLAHVKRQAAQLGPRGVSLARALAAARFEHVLAIDQQLAARGQSVAPAAEWIAEARALLAQTDTQLSAGNLELAHKLASRTSRPLGLLARAQWDKAVALLDAPASSPLAATYATLPQQAAMMQQLAGLRPGHNRLEEGSMEDLARLQAAQWRHWQHPQQGIETSTQLTSRAVHGGRHSLRLAARHAAGDESVVVETPPVWVTTPRVPVEPGAIVRIHGWVLLPRDLEGSVDGLMIIDSLGGTPLAQRVGRTDGWQEFALYRATLSESTIDVTFALSGLGEALIDDVTIEVLVPAGSGPQPSSPGGYPGTQRLPAVSGPPEPRAPWAAAQAASAPVPYIPYARALERRGMGD